MKNQAVLHRLFLLHAFYKLEHLVAFVGIVFLVNHRLMWLKYSFQTALPLVLRC